MNTNSPSRVALPTVLEDFDQHLALEYNKRILFSAKFGAGKSTFLNSFFDEKNDDFIVLKLYPVNYSVASNEDVFELIKYDLFSELLARYADQLQMDDEDFSTLLIAQSYAAHDVKLYPFIKALLKAAVPNGEAITEVVDAAKDIYKGFKNYQEKINRKEKDIIDDYVKWCEKRKGSIYERDEITSLLTDLIARVKSKLSDKPVILIIDDLDRLDPEHVFRLFNIFSAHYDAITDKNKFGVDKVIFVCDYQNIMLMYRHRYGLGVDFEGYINKFYSTKVFNFDPTRHLIDSIEDLLLKKPTVTDLRNHRDYGEFSRNNNLVRSLTLLFADLIQNKFLTFRSLEQFKHYSIPEYHCFKDGSRFLASKLPFVTFINLVIQSVSLDLLEDALADLANGSQGYTFDEYEDREELAYAWLINNTLPLLLTGRQITGRSKETETVVIVGNERYQLSLEYSYETSMIKPKFQDLGNNYRYNVYGFLLTGIKIGKRYNLFR